MRYGWGFFGVLKIRQVNEKNIMKKVKIGSKVTIEFNDGEKETFEIVTCGEANAFCGKVSADAPFGKAVTGKNEGAIVTYSNSLKKPVSCTILRII